MQATKPLTYIAADENEAVDKSNILKGDRLRHAKPQTSNKYNEGPDEDDLPAGAYWFANVLAYRSLHDTYFGFALLPTR